MSDVVDFGFEESSIIKPTGVELFKQTRSGEKNKVSVIAFRTYFESESRKRAKERGEALNEQEKSELVIRIDQKLSEKLGKEISALTAVDRLDIMSPKFWMAFTHSEYREDGKGIGTIKCLSKYEGNNCIKPEACCDKFGDAEQRVGTVVLVYPVDDSGQVDGELLKARKYTRVNVWVMNSKKFGKLDGTYKDARADNSPVIDLSVTLDGDAKYQKQVIERASSAFWARQNADADVRHWVLDQGVRAQKYIEPNLGFKMSKEKLLEKLHGTTHAISGAAGESAPKLQSGYDSLLK